MDVNSGELTLSGFWQYINATRDVGKPFNLIVVLPFTVQAYLNSSFYTPSIKNWNFINTNITNVVASAVSVNFTYANTRRTGPYFFAQFIVANTYTNSHRGAYQVLLTLDTGVGGPNYLRC